MTATRRNDRLTLLHYSTLLRPLPPLPAPVPHSPSHLPSPLQRTSSSPAHGLLSTLPLRHFPAAAFHLLLQCRDTCWPLGYVRARRRWIREYRFRHQRRRVGRWRLRRSRHRSGRRLCVRRPWPRTSRMHFGEAEIQIMRFLRRREKRTVVSMR